jgi:hypothetical protein
MKKYIFTESQIKKILDNQINEQDNSIGGVKTSVSRLVSSRTFYDSKLLNNLTYKVLSIDHGTPMINNKLITIGTTIHPMDVLTFKQGEEIKVSNMNPKGGFHYVSLYMNKGQLTADVTSN